MSRSFAHFLTELSFYYWVVRIFMYSRHKFFIRYMICKYLLPLLELPFYCLDGVLWKTKVFVFDDIQNFDDIQIVYMFFAVYAFGVISKKPLSNLRLWRFMPISIFSNLLIQNSIWYSLLFIYLVLSVLGLCSCCQLSLVAESEGSSLLWLAGSRCGGFFFCRAQAPGCAGFSHCGTGA